MSDDRRIRTWVERVSLVVIVASVSTLAYPKYGSLQREKIASQMLDDVDVVRAAVYRFYSDSAYFPSPSPGEPIPASLVEYLPPMFARNRVYGAIEYRNWPMRGDSAVVPAPNVVGVTVTVSDGRVGETAMRMAPPRTAKFVVGDKYTFLFFGT